MWPAIISGISSLFNGWIKTKTAKQEDEADYHMSAPLGEIVLQEMYRYHKDHLDATHICRGDYYLYK